MILQNDFWQSISRFRQSSCTMQFSEGVAYRTAVNIIFQYLHNGYHQNPLFGSNFMTKKSSHIFEQWVLTQLVTSIVVDDEYYVFLAEKGPVTRMIKLHVRGNLYFF